MPDLFSSGDYRPIYKAIGPCSQTPGPILWPLAQPSVSVHYQKIRQIFVSVGFTQHSFKNAARGVVNVAYAQWMCLPMYVNNSLTSVPRCYTCTNPCLTRTHKCVYMFTLSLALLCAQLEHVNDEKELTFQNLLEHDKLSRRNFSRARIIR